MGSAFLSAVPKIQWDSNTHAPTAIRLWETFTFLGGTVVVKSSVVPQRPCDVAGLSRLDWIYVSLLCMQDGTVATGDMN